MTQAKFLLQLFQTQGGRCGGAQIAQNPLRSLRVVAKLKA